MPQKERDQHLLDQALAELKTVLDPQLSLDDSVYSEPLFEACQWVGRQIQLKFYFCKEGVDVNKSIDERIHALCFRSSIYYRKVVLPVNWWRCFSSSFVGFDKDTRQPLALLFDAHQGFVVGGTSLKVDQKMADQLSAEAFIFFRALPPEKLTLRNLWMFNIWHWRHEWLTFASLVFSCFAISLFFPLFTQWIFDYVIPGRDLHLLYQMVLGGTLIIIAGLVFNYNREALFLRLSGLIDHDMEMAIWQRLLQWPASFFRSRSLYDLFVFTTAISSIRQILSSQVAQILLNAVFSIFLVMLLFYYSQVLAFVGLGLLIIDVLLTVLALPFGVRFCDSPLGKNSIILRNFS